MFIFIFVSFRIQEHLLREKEKNKFNKNRDYLKENKTKVITANSNI